MIRKILLFFPLIFITVQLYGQTDRIEAIETSVQESDVKMHTYFLASDEFMGRDTGTPHLDIAGRYIATWFMIHGVSPLPGQDDYYQTIPFIQTETPYGGDLMAGDERFSYLQDFVILNSPRGEFTGTIEVLEYGLGQGLNDLDLEGKIVIVHAGQAGETSPQQWFMTTEIKHRELSDRGATAIVELYDSPQIPWQLLAGYLSEDQLEVDKRGDDHSEPVPHIWLNSTGRDLHTEFLEKRDEEIRITIAGEPSRQMTSHNVLGYIEGSDPELQEEYILLGAHYDHVGVVPGMEEGNYIYNGARDNAVGTSAIMLTARYLAENPPKRSVLFAAWTAEEAGLLGSRYFTENPMVPLDRIVYHLNIDGAGYNDTTKVTVIGLERTDAEEDLKSAAAAFGLEAIRDPVPEQNLFDRSDNVNFARHGIPAPTYSLGLTAFDAEIAHYYHTVDDEPHTLNYPYITNYIRSYVLAADKVANSDTAPFWREGDVYEEAGRQLYRRE